MEYNSGIYICFSELLQIQTAHCCITLKWGSTASSPCSCPSCRTVRFEAHEWQPGVSAQSLNITQSSAVTCWCRETAERVSVWLNSCRRQWPSSPFTTETHAKVSYPTWKGRQICGDCNCFYMTHFC